jgi:hypothetical protein
MAIGTPWQPLTAAAIDALPDAMAVFEIGSLVRNVLVIGGDANEGLRAAVRRALDNPRLRLRARCIRWELTSDPRARAAQLLAAYRASHEGASPAEQPRTMPATVHVILPHAGDVVPAAIAEPLPAKRPSAPASFLRVRTVA